MEPSHPQDCIDLSLYGGSSCSHPDCGPTCIPPTPTVAVMHCEQCNAPTEQEAMHDPWGVHVLDRCLTCGLAQ